MTDEPFCWVLSSQDSVPESDTAVPTVVVSIVSLVADMPSQALSSVELSDRALPSVAFPVALNRTELHHYAPVVEYYRVFCKNL